MDEFPDFSTSPNMWNDGQELSSIEIPQNANPATPGKDPLLKQDAVTKLFSVSPAATTTAPWTPRQSNSPSPETNRRSDKRKRTQDKGNVLKKACSIQKKQTASRDTTPFYNHETPQISPESSSTALPPHTSQPCIEIRPSDANKITILIPKQMLRESTIIIAGDYFEFESVVHRNGDGERRYFLIKMDQNY
jgi:hypothetical protein